MVSDLVVAVIGSRSALGKGLIRILLNTRAVRKIVAIDLRPPATTSPSVVFQRIDLTHPSATEELSRVFEREEVDAVAHLALLGAPLANRAYSHELVVGGTNRLLSAAIDAGVEHLVFRSSTLLYGASPKHPALLREESPFSQGGPPFIRDWRQAEASVIAASKRGGGPRIAVLRFAPEFGDDTGTIFQRYLTAKAAPVVAGYDPLIQVLHEEDGSAALAAVISRKAEGVFNVAPEGWIPLLAALRLLGTAAVPGPRPVTALALGGLRSLGVFPSWQDEFLDFLQFPLVADGSLFRQEFGFQFRFGVREALERGRRH